MRWFFLTFVLALAWLGNAAIFESLSPMRAAAGVAFNIFIGSLLVIWWSAYFLITPSRQKSLVVGHALLMLSVGVALACIGVGAFVGDSCEGMLSSGRRSSLRSQVASYFQDIGYCRELGVGIGLFGFLMAYPSIRLFVGLARRSS